MKKIENVKEFVEKVDQAKKINPKDLSSDQDLTIGIMNLISIEEHLMFSGAKTSKNSFYDLIDSIRDLRKRLMQKVIPSYEGEVWCISKHLLSSSMRLMEVGTKQLSIGNKEEAYNLFEESYNLYCIFWGLNMNILNVDDIKWVEETKDDIEKIKNKAKELTEEITFNQNYSYKKKDNKDNNEINKEKNSKANKESTFEKMKGFIKKAINCCIE